MKKILFNILLLTTSALSQAQTENLYGGAGHFRFGYANHNLSPMNAWLSNIYPTIKNDFITLGGTGYAIRNNVIVGGEGFGSIGATVSKDTLSISPTLGRGMLNAGYVVYESRNFLLYPLMGFGGGGTSIRFSENDGYNGITNRIKSNGYTLTNSNLLLSISIGADSYFLSSENKRGVSFGVRFGYIYSMQNSTWKQKNSDIAGPNLNSSGFYFTIGIGGGKLVKK